MDEIPAKLLANLRRVPLVSEYDIDRVTYRMDALTTLSARELMVLRCLGDGGFTLGETASTLGCSLETVKSHVKSVKAKLRAKTTMQAVARAIRQDLI